MLCRNGLHERNSTVGDSCRGCWNATRKRYRAKKAGLKTCACGVEYRKIGHASFCPACVEYRKVNRCGDCSEEVPKSRRYCDSCKSARRIGVLQRKLSRERELYFSNLERSRSLGMARYRRAYAKNPAPYILRGIESAHKRRAMKAEAYGSHTTKEWRAILRKQKERCAECGVKGGLQRDHIVPLSKGGSDFAFNIQGLCKTCNCEKKDKMRVIAVSLFDKVAV